jgi:hypothetical protein
MTSFCWFFTSSGRFSSSWFDWIESSYESLLDQGPTSKDDFSLEDLTSAITTCSQLLSYQSTWTRRRPILVNDKSLTLMELHFSHYDTMFPNLRHNGQARQFPGSWRKLDLRIDLESRLVIVVDETRRSTGEGYRHLDIIIFPVVCYDSIAVGNILIRTKIESINCVVQGMYKQVTWCLLLIELDDTGVSIITCFGDEPMFGQATRS